jgi:glycosyltransferase involved in cell wall biosynthesis
VIPVYDEATSIPLLLPRLVPVLEATGAAFEVIFVDDGSRDRTASLIREAHARDGRIKLVALSRNFGKEIAVAAGLRAATGDATVLMDADLQHAPELLPTFIAGWRAGHEVVYGQRLDRDTDSPLRRKLSVAFYRLFAALSGTHLHDGGGDFLLLGRRARDAFNRLGERARFNKGLYAWIGFSPHPVPFTMAERADGTPSRWSYLKLVRLAVDGLISFTTLPLRIWSLVGVAVSALAFLYIVGFLIKTLIYGIDQAGFPTLVVSIMFFAGIQLISLGVIGEYLGRIYEEVKGRPLYVVAEELGLDAPLGGHTPAAAPPFEVVDTAHGAARG